MTLEESILDKVRRLPPARQEQVLRFADKLQQESDVRAVPSRDRRREMNWIKENRARYANQWVVVDGECLIAADPDGHKAFAAAKAAGIDIPFLFAQDVGFTRTFLGRSGWLDRLRIGIIDYDCLLFLSSYNA